MKRAEEYGVCGWGANSIETDLRSIRLHSKKMVLGEQILPARIKIASFCIAQVKLSVSLRQLFFW
jgi:hypothetical protein